MPKKKSMQSLLDQKTRIEQEIADLQRSQRMDDLIESPEFQKVAKKVAALQLTDDEVVGLFTRRPKRSSQKKTATPKKKPTGIAFGTYQHPEDPSVTWSGRGRKPAWIIAWIESGKPIKELRKA